jgi:hypothetical protein
MVRGWLDPCALILICCFSATGATQGLSNAAQAVSLRLRPCDHYCVHCGIPNVVEFEQVVYRCDSCSGRNSRWEELLSTRNWKPASSLAWEDLPDPEPDVSPRIDLSAL